MVHIRKLKFEQQEPIKLELDTKTQDGN